MNQMAVIKEIKSIINKLKISKLTEPEAINELRNLLGSSENDSLRWKIFSENRMMDTPADRMGKACRKRLKELLLKIDPEYFENVEYWGAL